MNIESYIITKWITSFFVFIRLRGRTMEKIFLEEEINGLIPKADPVDHKMLEVYVKMIGSPQKVGDFFHVFQKALKKGNTLQIICFKIIEKIRSEKFFSLVLEEIKASENPIQVHTAFKSTIAIPDDLEIVDKYLEIIIDLMKRNSNAEVLYHGVCLIYRIVTKHPTIELKLQKNPLLLEYQALQGILRMFDMLDKWETEGHIGRSKPGYFKDKTAFIDFAMKFIKFQ